MKTYVDELKEDIKNLEALNESLELANEELETANEQLRARNEELEDENRELEDENRELDSDLSEEVLSLALLQDELVDADDTIDGLISNAKDYERTINTLEQMVSDYQERYD